MSRTLPGSFLSLEDEDWDSFELIQPFHMNGGNHLLSTPAQTPSKRALQVGSWLLQRRYLSLYLSDTVEPQSC